MTDKLDQHAVSMSCIVHDKICMHTYCLEIPKKSRNYNFFIHLIMYSYYFFKGTRLNIIHTLFNSVLLQFENFEFFDPILSAFPRLKRMFSTKATKLELSLDSDFLILSLTFSTILFKRFVVRD